MTNNFTCISVQKAQEIIASSKTTIVDIRDPGAFAQGHIAQAQSINDDNIEVFLQESDKQIPLICYCYHGFSSQRAASFFAAQGFNEVYSVDGGWEEWKKIHG